MALQLGGWWEWFVQARRNALAIEVRSMAEYGRVLRERVETEIM
jgi:hypothetical protein